jgi:hypothetical protein
LTQDCYVWLKPSAAELDGQVKVFDVLPPCVESELSQGVAGATITPDRVAAGIVAGLR